MISANDKSKCSSIKKKFFPEAANPAYIPQMNEKSLKNLELLFSTSIFQAPMLKDMSLLAKYGAKIYAFEFAYKVWQYRLWSFQERDTKLERFLAKNQLDKRKLSNFENWSCGELSKIGHHFRK